MARLMGEARALVKTMAIRWRSLSSSLKGRGLAIGLGFSHVILGFMSFPGISLGWLAWISMMPMLLLRDHTRNGLTFLVHVWFWEFVKWSLLVVWLRHVSWAAVLGAALGFSVWHTLWYGMWNFTRVRLKRKCFAGLTAVLVSIALSGAWAAMEWMRTHPFGLPGGHLAITQWNLPLWLQLAGWLGGYGLGGVVVWSNLMLYQVWVSWKNRLMDPPHKGWQETAFWMVSWAGIMVAIPWIGLIKVRDHDHVTAQMERKTLQVGVIQLATPPYRHWTYERVHETVSSVRRLSMQLVKEHPIELMLWPEGTLPGSVHPGSVFERELLFWVESWLKVPLLFGNQVESGTRLENAVLFAKPGAGVADEWYAKRILVPFGEYIPFRKWMPGISTIVPIPNDFHAGTHDPTFVVNGVNIRARICYEDCFPGSFLGDDLEDVDLMVLASYNGWYGKELGAEFHAAHSVLRSVEINRPFIRCSNGGWSGWIDAAGRIRDVLMDPGGEGVYFEGYGVLAWKSEPRTTTFYYRNHRWLHAVYGGLFILVLVIGWSRLKHSR
jgi:apolipoprotein N-acyltransferase